jgi:hypothetical protein
MEDDSNQFREYAAQCRRMAEKLSGNNREVLLEIANAWIDCAEQVENKMQARAKKD